MGKDAPDPPNYKAAAEAQAASSREVTEQQTWANRPEQVTPWGTQSWQNKAMYDPSTDQMINRWRQTTTLTPELQAALDSQLRLQRDKSQLAESLTGRMEREYSKPMDWGNLPQMGQRVNAHDLVRGQAMAEGYDIAGPDLNPAARYNQDANEAIYNQWAERALPEQAKQTESARTKLYNMGLREGDAAFDREMNRVEQSQGDALRQAQYQATIGSGAEAQRMLGMDAATRAQLTGENLGQAQFHNQAVSQDFGQRLAATDQHFENMMQASQYQTQRRQQELAERMQKRGFSLNEINALLHGQQVAMPSMPGFNTAQRSEGVQALSAAQMQGQAELDAFNAEQQAMQGMMQGVGSLAGGFMPSDRRLKRNVRRIGITAGGAPVYRFRYIFDVGGSEHIGVMADEVPYAAVNIGGYDYVDYSKVR